jgi:hypothetical protein
MQTRRKTQLLQPKPPSPLVPSVGVVFQKSGGFLDALPTAIFYILQEFLSSNEYLALMNVSLSSFQSIKFETVQYSFVGPEKWSKLGITEKNIVHILKNVKDKSKQITMRFEKAKQEIVARYARLFDGIHKLSIEEQVRYTIRNRGAFKNSFSFAVFDNIFHLKLANISGIKTLALNSPKLCKLEVCYCHFEEIKTWNDGNQLQSLVYLVSVHVNGPIIPTFKGIPEVTVNSWSQLSSQSFGNHSSLTCNCSGFPIPVEILHQPFLLQQLTSLTLESEFPAGHYDFSFCRQIQFLSLKQARYYSYAFPSQNCPSFPVFHGQEIHLRRFSLVSWNGECFKRLKKCFLEDCKDLIQFPAAPVVQELEFTNCADLVGLPAELPHLSHLKVSSCAKFQTLFFYPRLQEVGLHYCSVDFKDYQLFSHVKSLELQGCAGIDNLIPFGKIQKLTIQSCAALSMEGIAGTPQYQEDQRMIHFRYVTSLTNLHFCHHIYQLDLEGVRLASLKGIRNVHHLKISCSSLKTTKGLENITGSLTIPNAWGLRSLEGVKNIPVVTISYGTYINDFKGLGNHQELHMLRVPKFEKFLDQFREKKEHSELFGSIEHLFVKTKYDKNPKQIW